MNRRPPVGVFSVDDHAVQVQWRGLRPGTLRVEVADVVRELTVRSSAGVATIEGLPAGRLLTLACSGSALPEPVTVTARTLDELPGAELYRIATVSDLHLGTWVFGYRGTILERPTPVQPHPVRCARAALDEACRWGAQRIIVKGDITNSGQVDHWRTYATLIRDLPVPVDALPGNHDRHYRPRTPGLVPAEAARAFGLTMADPVLVRDVPGLRIVLVDTTTDERNRGTFTAVRAQVLDAVSEADRSGGVLVAHHQQFHAQRAAEGVPVGISHAESVDLMEALGRAHPHVLATAGHTHRNRRWAHAGVTATQVGATKDYPGVWAGYVVHEGGIRQIVRRIERPDCVRWTEHTRRAGVGTWRWLAPGRLDARCFNLRWSEVPQPIS